MNSPVGLQLAGRVWWGVATSFPLRKMHRKCCNVCLAHGSRLTARGSWLVAMRRALLWCHSAAETATATATIVLATTSCIIMCGNVLKWAIKIARQPLAAKLAPRHAAPRKVTKMKPRITLNRHLIIPSPTSGRPSLIAFLQVVQLYVAPSKGKTTKTGEVKKNSSFPPLSRSFL